MRDTDRQHRPGGGVGRRAAKTAPRQHIEFNQQREGQEIRLHCEAQPRHQPGRDAQAARHVGAAGTRAGNQQIGHAQHHHDVLALGEHVVRKDDQQEQQQHRQQRRRKRTVRFQARRQHRPAGLEGGQDPKPQQGDQHGRAAEAGQLGQRLRQQVQHEDQRRVDVDGIDIEPPALQPEFRDIEQDRRVMVDRRQEIAGQPDDADAQDQCVEQPRPVEAGKPVEGTRVSGLRGVPLRQIVRCGIVGIAHGRVGDTREHCSVLGNAPARPELHQDRFICR
jgi:hypothetical protein